jgi:hypothetical protein
MGVGEVQIFVREDKIKRSWGASNAEMVTLHNLNLALTDNIYNYL